MLWSQIRLGVKPGLPDSGGRPPAPQRLPAGPAAVAAAAAARRLQQADQGRPPGGSCGKGRVCIESFLPGN